MNSQGFAIMPEEDDILKLMEGIIDEEYIRNETGEDDLSHLDLLTLVINTSHQSIYDLHHFLPALQHLVLDKSVISTVRDLGTGLRFLKSLSLASCGLYDLDGIGVLTSLQELCLKNNHITDVTPLAMHENLESLNLSENRISDISIADSLSSCLCLRALFLSKNPLTKARNYRLIVASLVPGLQMLDGTPVDPQASKKVTNGMILESAADMRVAEEDLDDELRLENEILGQSVATAPRAEVVPSSRSATSSGQANGASECLPDTGSELTHGSSVVLAGSMAAAVRKRRQLATDSNPNGKCDQLLEYESTLDMLDAALQPTTSLRNDPSSNHGSRKGSQPSSRRSTPRMDGTDSTSFFKEGDVTASYLSHTSPQVDDEDDAPFDPNASPSVRRRDFDRDRDRSLKDGLASPAMHKSGAKASSKRGGSTTMSMSFEADVATSQQRPKSAGPKRSVSLPSPGLAPVSSPRQRNSSRPQSAISVGSPKQEVDYMSANAAPFKVAVDKQRRADDVTARVEASPPLPQIKPAAPGSSIVHLDIVRRAPASGYMIAQDTPSETVSHGLVFPGMANDDEDSETEDIAVTHAARHRLMATSSVSNNAHSVTANLKSRQNILQQLKATVGKADPQEEDLSPDEHGQDLDMDTHENASRAGKLKADPSVGRFDIVGIAARGDNTSRGGSRRGSRTGDGAGAGSRAECELESLEQSPQRPPVMKNGRAPKDTMSSKAGISLGFNLAGSLAAIDKWVQDMNSEDEDNSHSDNNNSADSSDEDEDLASNSMARKKSLLFALSAPHEKEKRITSRESSNKQLNLDTIDNPSGLETNSKDSFSEYSNSSASRPKNKILSRDAIISMCTGGGRDSARDSARDSDEEDSDLDVPDLRVNLSRITTSKDEIVPPSAQAAPARKRDADVRNRLKRGSSHGTPRATPKRSEANDLNTAATGVAVESSEARENRTRTRRVVPDFPVVEPVERIVAPVREPVPVDEVSPPRYTAPAARVDSNTASLDPEAGPAVAMTDTELVHLLRQQPKHTEQLKTKNNFQAFFKKINEQRMRSLLLRAYADIAESSERNEKVEKRMNLLDGFLS